MVALWGGGISYERGTPALNINSRGPESGRLCAGHILISLIVLIKWFYKVNSPTKLIDLIRSSKQ